MTRKDYEKVYVATEEKRPTASRKTQHKYAQFQRALDAYLNEIEIDTFAWGFEMGRAWERSQYIHHE